MWIPHVYRNVKASKRLKHNHSSSDLQPIILTFLDVSLTTNLIEIKTTYPSLKKNIKIWPLYYSIYSDTWKGLAKSFKQ